MHASIQSQLKAKGNMRKSRSVIKQRKKKGVSVSPFESIYYNPIKEGALGGVKRLTNEIKNPLSKKKVKTWLSSQLAYSLHKPMKKKFPTRSYQTSGLNDLWQMDLMEMIPYAKINKGYKYILTCIDVFSRYVRALPIKSKSAIDVAEAVNEMIKNTTPRHIQTDMGKEFYNKSVQSIFKKHGIKHYSVTSQFKAAVVERFNRTLRQKLARYFTSQGNKKWVDVLATLIDTYNKSQHRGIFNKRPIDITSENEQELWTLQQQQSQKVAKNVINIPLLHYVRISKATNSPFVKNFQENWSDEIFRVVGIDKKVQPIMYIIEDMKGEIIEGKFYKEELQDVGSIPPSVSRIEKIVSTKGKGVYKQYLVKWYGYDSSHNSWISAKDFVHQ